MIINIESKEQFDEEIKLGVVLIDFWAPWCGPCRMLAPNLEEVSKELENVKILKINVDNFEEIARAYGVSAIPTLYFLINGEEITHTLGVKSSQEIIDLIKSNVA